MFGGLDRVSTNQVQDTPQRGSRRDECLFGGVGLNARTFQSFPRQSPPLFEYSLLIECPAKLPRRLERVLSNLLGNALKYSAPGTDVRVTLTTERGTDSGWAIVRVIDYGAGIPVGDLPHVFDPFFRASNVQTIALGAGIGLAGVRQIVQQHGGWVTLESSLGQGTTCTVRLPLKDEVELEMPARSGEAPGCEALVVRHDAAA